jgi:hypothetical protein
MKAWIPFIKHFFLLSIKLKGLHLLRKKNLIGKFPKKEGTMKAHHGISRCGVDVDESEVG